MFCALTLSAQNPIGNDSQRPYNPPATDGFGNVVINGICENGAGIDYHCGPLMTSVTNVYYIWYGDWTDNTAPDILTDFANSFGGSPYYNINTTYHDGDGNPVQNAVSYGGSTNDSYSRGENLSDTDIRNITLDAINLGTLPRDPDGIYFVLTSADVNTTSGFCNRYCGWHTATFNGGDWIKYSFVGNPDRCPWSCTPNPEVSPNDNVGADGMANTIAHELEETTSDPQLNAWYDNRGQENADQCVWTFGDEYRTDNGARANMNLGGRDFMIQLNWVNAGNGYCATSY